MGLFRWRELVARAFYPVTIEQKRVSVNLKSKIIKAAMLIAVTLFFTGVYQLFVYDGKAKGCSGENFQKHRDTMATEHMVRGISKECGSYGMTFKIWKYLTLTTVVVFLGSGFYRVAKQE
jgi:hypothetical protein